MSRYPSFFMSRFFRILEGLNIIAQDEPQNIVFFLAKTSYSTPTRSAARKRVVFLLRMSGRSRWIQQLQVAAMSVFVTSSFSLSTQLVRNSNTSLSVFTTWFASSQSSEVKSLGLMSMQMAREHLIDLFSVVIKSKYVNSLPSLAHSLSLQYRWLFRQFTTSLPLRSTTAAELNSPYYDFQMYPNPTQALSRVAISLANSKSIPWSGYTAWGSASWWLVKLQPAKAISGKRMMSSLELGLQIWSDLRTLSTVLSLSLWKGLIWQSSAFKFLTCFSKGASIINQVRSIIAEPFIYMEILMLGRKCLILFSHYDQIEILAQSGDKNVSLPLVVLVL